MSTASGVATVAVVLAFIVGCRNTQDVHRCTACTRESPPRCATYEGHCYGPASNSMPASSVQEAQELAAQRVCSRYFEPTPPGGTPPQCRVGISWSAPQRGAALTHFRFECATTRERCP